MNDGHTKSGRDGHWTWVTLYLRGSNSEKVLKYEKKIGIETLFLQPIFVFLGRELLPKFSIVTKIVSNSIDGLPALAPSALDGSPTLAPSALDSLPALPPPPLALAFKI